MQDSDIHEGIINLYVSFGPNRFNDKVNKSIRLGYNVDLVADSQHNCASESNSHVPDVHNDYSSAFVNTFNTSQYDHKV